MNEYENQRDNPNSYCYKCKNYHWGCLAYEWDEGGVPLRSDGNVAQWCHSKFDGDE